ncbi:MAG: XdhC family protein [Acidimicrobiales bacterium]|jgi:xanthine dehydrogenase accessory factor|nr:XdhC family protein [Acidimicrobiales bacterium]
MGKEALADGWGVIEHAVNLRRKGEAFVLATVVWREGPSSGQQGSRAIVTGSGQIFGWIGGACAEPVLIREALRALQSQESRLLAIGSSDHFGELPKGTTEIAISCQSNGALQIFIEPIIPAPELIVVGRSPMARTLHELATNLDWDSHLIDGPDFSSAAISSRSMVVVATQGHGDEEIVESALAGRPSYLGVVGSPQRGKALLGYLSDRNISQELLDTIRVPIGLDLGRTTHREVAVAVLAELVQLRPSLEAPQGKEPVVVPITEVEDPICGMTVNENDASHPLVVAGQTYYFCCLGCRSQYEKQVAEADVVGSAKC